MADEGLERLPVGPLPGAGEGHDVPIAPRVDQLPIGPGSVGGLGYPDDLLAPGWRPEMLEQLPQQGIFRVGARRALAPDQGESHRAARDVPLGHEEDDAKANDRRMVPVEARVVGHRRLGAPCALEGAVAHQRPEAIRGWSKSLQGLVGKPPP